MNQSTYHRFKSIPTPRVISYNINSYGSRATSKKARARQAKVLANLKHLAKHVDILLIQETKTAALTDFYTNLLPAFEPFKNPEPDSDDSAGTDIFVRRTFMQHFELTHKIIVEGHVHFVLFMPNDTSLFVEPFASTYFRIELHDK